MTAKGNKRACSRNLKMSAFSNADIFTLMKIFCYILFAAIWDFRGQARFRPEAVIPGTE